MCHCPVTASGEKVTQELPLLGNEGNQGKKVSDGWKLQAALCGVLCNQRGHLEPSCIYLGFLCLLLPSEAHTRPISAVHCCPSSVEAVVYAESIPCGPTQVHPGPPEMHLQFLGDFPMIWKVFHIKEYDLVHPIATHSHFFLCW